MKVYIKPPAHLSQAMFRVERSLAAHAPMSVQVVQNQDEADLVVLHTIGYPETIDAVRQLISRGQNYAIIQYCLRTTQQPDTRAWLGLWQMSECVWSYYDLEALLNVDHQSVLDDWCIPFHHAPLGVDSVFTRPQVNGAKRDVGIISSGYVAGSEAIEEVAIAAEARGLSVAHIGPAHVAGMTRAPGATWYAAHGISDVKLASLYHSAKWVSGLRRVEGFELPALEGLCCGARPILFDRPEMRRWYGDHAVYVPECGGGELIDHLADTLATEPEPVRPDELADVYREFAWAPIVKRFWEVVGA